ncbi:dihydrofolate reductase family protein [Galbitalea soli]|uniref:Pyrimidine reductase n=1 Tax=Galbitalea soli TaxID=1268042 RepID=A0A7C9PLH3_9MICO|nr:pyrimidine reductase [Galbitalea soli]NYJ30960.1 riboflavin biosynthesis pyrimidine reductase [Galbitalea soli]
MILTRVFPGPPDPIELSWDDSRSRLAELYRPPRADWLRLNLVASVSGSATGSDGTSESITVGADRVLLGVIRGLADAVVVGASSVRAEGYFVPRAAALAVVTRTGELSGHRITSGGPRGPLLILCPAAAAERARTTVGVAEAQIIPVPDADGWLAAADIVGALRANGYASLVSEGGPQLARHLLLGGVVDELCLSTSPTLNGAGVPIFGGTEFDALPLALAQLMVDDASGVYARWRLTAG